MHVMKNIFTNSRKGIISRKNISGQLKSESDVNKKNEKYEKVGDN